MVPEQQHESQCGQSYISFTRKTNNITFRYTLYLTHLARFPCIKDLEVLLASRLHFHTHVDHIVAEALKILRLIHYITSSFSSIDNFLTFYRVLVSSNLEIASVAWNSLPLTDSSNIERALLPGL